MVLTRKKRRAKGITRKRCLCLTSNMGTTLPQCSQPNRDELTFGNRSGMWESVYACEKFGANVLTFADMLEPAREFVDFLDPGKGMLKGGEHIFTNEIVAVMRSGTFIDKLYETMLMSFSNAAVLYDQEEAIAERNVTAHRGCKRKARLYWKRMVEKTREPIEEVITNLSNAAKNCARQIGVTEMFKNEFADSDHVKFCKYEILGNALEEAFEKCKTLVLILTELNHERKNLGGKGPLSEPWRSVIKTVTKTLSLINSKTPKTDSVEAVRSDTSSTDRKRSMTFIPSSGESTFISPRLERGTPDINGKRRAEMEPISVQLIDKTLRERPHNPVVSPYELGSRAGVPKAAPSLCGSIAEEEDNGNEVSKRAS
eukprot:Nk52_evm34s215 gene=Nk52_evmTU34s215